MNINATLLGQMITFALFIWFTMKFVWPPIMKALAARQDRIAEGLAAAERGHKDLELAQQKATEQLRQAKQEANHLIEQARHRGDQIIEQSKLKAQEESKRSMEMTQAEINQAVIQAKQALRNQVSSVAVMGAEKILGRTIDQAANNDLIEKFIAEL